MIEFEKPRITKIDEDRDYGKFVVEPLERGYGFYRNVIEQDTFRFERGIDKND